MKAKWRSNIEVEDSRENDKSEIDEKSSILDMLGVAFDFDSVAILIGYPKNADQTEQLHPHYCEVENLSLPAPERSGDEVK